MARRYRRKRKDGERRSLVDILIPVYGRFDLLSKCLEHIPKAFGDIPFKVFLYDNGSPVHSSEINSFYNGIKKKYSFVSVTKSSNNLGFPRACNVLARKAKAPLLFFLNSDVFLDPESGKQLVLKMDEPEIGVVGMKLRFPDWMELDDPGNKFEQHRPSNQLQHIGLGVNIRMEVYHLFMGWSPDHPRINKQSDVPAVTGAAIMTRRQLFQDAGGFLEIYGLGTYEDVDYCLTINEMGFRIVVEPKAEAVHVTNGSALYYSVGYPMQANAFIFMNRWMKKVKWEEWKYL